MIHFGKTLYYECLDFFKLRFYVCFFFFFSKLNVKNYQLH